MHRATRSLLRPWLGAALTLGCAFSLLIVSGCGKGKGGASTPEKTVQNMFDATKDKDLDGVLACFAPDLREMFEEMMKVGDKGKVEDQLMHGEGRVGKLKILSTKIDGDWAKVETSVTVGGKEEKDTLELHKIGGAWFVDMPAEQKQGMKAVVEMMKNPDKMKEMMEGMTKEMRKNMPTPPQ